MKLESKNIEIFVLDKSDKAKACRVFREYTDCPYSELLTSIENHEASIKIELIPDKIFDGVNNLVELVGKLESEGIFHRVYVNGQAEAKEALIKIKEKVESLSLKDFR